MTEINGNISRYIRGDAEAAREVDLTTHELRKLRLTGKLKGAVAKFGHRTTIYDRDRLKRCIAAVFEV